MSSKVAPQDAASDRGSTYAVVENVENNDSHTISIRRASQQEETEASIAGMLANARAEGRSARFRLTVVPVVAGLFLMFGSIFLYAIGVPYIAALFPPGAVVVGLSLLPNDKMAIIFDFQTHLKINEISMRNNGHLSCKTAIMA